MPSQCLDQSEGSSYLTRPIRWISVRYHPRGKHNKRDSLPTAVVRQGRWKNRNMIMLCKIGHFKKFNKIALNLSESFCFWEQGSQDPPLVPVPVMKSFRPNFLWPFLTCILTIDNNIQFFFCIILIISPNLRFVFTLSDIECYGSLAFSS